MALSRAERAILKSRRRNALKAKRKADIENGITTLPEEQEEAAKPSPGTSRGPKKLNPKDLAKQLAKIPPATLGIIAATGLAAAVGAGAVSLDARGQANANETAIQQQAETLSSIGQFVEDFPPDAAAILNEARGLRAEVEEKLTALDEQMELFDEQIAAVKLDAITPEQFNNLNSTVSGLQATTLSNTSAISNTNADLGAIRAQVNTVATGVATAQADAVAAADSATTAKAEADKAQKYATDAQTAATDAKAAAAAVEADLTATNAAVDQAAADAAAAQADATQAKADAAAAQDTADQALADAELALKQVPVVFQAFGGTAVDIDNGFQYVEAGTGLAEGKYSLDATYSIRNFQSGTCDVRLLPPPPYNTVLVADNKAQNGNNYTSSGYVTVYPGNIGTLGFRTKGFSGGVCIMSGWVISLQFIPE